MCRTGPGMDEPESPEDLRVILGVWGVNGLRTLKEKRENTAS